MTLTLGRAGWTRCFFVLALATIIAGCVSNNLSGTINGLKANGLVLANGKNTISPPANATSFTFSTPLNQGASYDVVVQTQPNGYICSVTNGSGVMGAIAVTNVVVTCESARRVELTNIADSILRRLDHEVSLALPNSLRVAPITLNGVAYNYIEFIETTFKGQYRDVLDGVAGYPLNFSDQTACATNPSKCQFDIVGTAPTDPPIIPGDFIVVYNLGQDSSKNSYAPVDAYADCSGAVGCNIAKIAPGGVVTRTGITTISLEPNSKGMNVFANQVPSLPSPSNRFHVVPQGIQAITYACPTAMGEFRHYQGYGLTVAQPTPPGGAAIIMATNSSCIVTYSSNVDNQHTGLLTISLTLTDVTNNENVTLVREIHLDNSP